MPIEVTGVKEMLAKLEKLGADVKRARIKALRKGASILREEMEQRARFVKGYSHGDIAANIVTIPVNTPDGEMSTDVGPDANKAYYAKYVEFGTPTQRAQPFVEPAFLAKRKEVLEAIASTLREVVERSTRNV